MTISRIPQETPDRIRGGQAPRNASRVLSLLPDAIRSLLQQGLIEMEGSYVTCHLDGSQQPISGTEHKVAIYRLKQTHQDGNNDEGNTEVPGELVHILEEANTLDGDYRDLPGATDPKVQEVIETINTLFDDYGYLDVHKTDIWTGTPQLSFNETQEVVVLMEQEGILRFDNKNNVCYLDEYHPSTKKLFSNGNISDIPNAFSNERPSSARQENEELFVLLDLSANDALSLRYVQELFPYETGDTLVFCHLEQAQALLRLQRSMLTKMQWCSLRETLAIVGYTLKVRENLPSSFLIAQVEQTVARSEKLFS